MHVDRARAWRKILITGLVLAYPTAFASPPAGPADEGRGAACGEMRPPPGPPPAPGMGMGPPGGEPAWDAPPPFLAGLELSDAQQDKVFAILHAAAPAIREQAKALRRSHEALRDMATSLQYDEPHARALADESAKAESQLSLLRTRAGHEIYALLTPEQRAQISDRKGDRQPWRGGPPAPR
jgi:periplasmic protein CpxP/Spy